MCSIFFVLIIFTSRAPMSRFDLLDLLCMCKLYGITDNPFLLFLLYFLTSFCKFFKSWQCDLPAHTNVWKEKNLSLLLERTSCLSFFPLLLYIIQNMFRTWWTSRVHVYRMTMAWGVWVAYIPDPSFSSRRAAVSNLEVLPTSRANAT